MDNLKVFYDGKNISNKSFNLLNKSNFIDSIKKMINNYKAKIKDKIETIIDKRAKMLLDLQAKIEKKGSNMKIKNKREHIQFKKTTQDFLIKKLYYIFQISLIIILIEKTYNLFFDIYNKEIEKLTEGILDKKNNENNKDIKYVLNHCFLTKLKDFGDSINIQIEVKNIDEQNDLPEEKEVQQDEEKQKNNELQLFNKFNNYEKTKTKNKDIIQTDDKNWFPFTLNQEGIKEDNIPLNNFLQNLRYQDSYFDKKTNDKTFNSLNEYKKQDLISFFVQKKKEFMKTIQKNYSNKIFYFEKELNEIITKIITKENVSKIYYSQIENEIQSININEENLKLKYMTIIIVGRSGI